ncbi:MAG: diaminopimelate epimerase [Acidimicrobiia bacterium]|nr:diaminopimelate epimerase [Acidimicrobiia bacterium]
MSRLEIVKAHGASNDFLVFEDLEDAFDLDDLTVTRLCERRRGVGADGVIRVVALGSGRVFMDHRNADASRPEMCGNGVRCFAKFCFDRGILTGTEATIETRSGPKHVVVHHDARGRVCRVSVDMGPPSFEPQEIPVTAGPGDESVRVHLDDSGHDAWFASMGNPHAVLFVEDPEAVPVAAWGATVETDDRFPHGVNVSFVRVLDRGHVRARVWERGVGETMACGTGACAVAAVSHRLEHVGRHVTVSLPGGDLLVDLGDTVVLTGPAVEVFTATVDTRALGL